MSSGRGVTIYVEHGAATSNIGDDALLLSAIDRLRRYLPHAHIRVPRRVHGRLPGGLGGVEIVPDLLGAFTAVSRLRLDRLRGRSRPEAAAARRRTADKLDGTPMRSLRPLLSADVLYVVGDNALNDLNPAGIVFRSWLCRQAKAAGSKVVLSSQGLGPLEDAWARTAVAEMLSTADVLTLRDHQYGLDFVRSLPGLTVAPEAVGDEAHFWSPNATDDACSLVRQAGLPTDEPFVAVHFRERDYAAPDPEYRQRLAWLLAKVARLADSHLLFIPMSYGRRYGRDVALGEALQAALGPNRLHVLSARDPAVVRSIVGQSAFTLGTSYHLHVFGLSQHRSAVAAYRGGYYGTKLEGLVGHYGPPSTALNLDLTDDNGVLAAVERALDSAGHASLVSANDRLRAVNETTLRQLAALIEQ